MNDLRATQNQGFILLKQHLNRKVVGFFMILVIFMYIITVLPTMIAYADQTNSKVKVYKSIEIKSGDTLWTIASENYSKEWKSITKYIEHIKRCNSLYEDDITAGCYLVIPYYTESEVTKHNS